MKSEKEIKLIRDESIELLKGEEYRPSDRYIIDILNWVLDDDSCMSKKLDTRLRELMSEEHYRIKHLTFPSESP